MRLTKNSKLICNVFFLLSAVFFIGLGIMVVFFNKAVDDFGESRIQNYVAQYQAKVDHALHALEQGHYEVIRDVLENDFSTIKKSDRVYPLKRQLLLAFVSQLQLQNNSLWRIWASHWYQLDHRDVTAMAYHYAALTQNNKDFKEGLKGLKSAQKRFPKHPLLKQFYAIALARSTQLND